LSQYGHFVDKRGVEFFAILCGRLLWTAPSYFHAARYEALF